MTEPSAISRLRVLAVAAVLLGWPSAAPRAAPAPTTIAILPIKLLDTSGEPVDQGAEHARRLAAMERQLARALAADGRYRTLSLSADDLRTRCADETPACLLAASAAAGADLVLVGVVHKSSTLILQIFVRLADARTGAAVLARDLNFRGDGDDAWHRAGDFLARQILDAAPALDP